MKNKKLSVRAKDSRDAYILLLPVTLIVIWLMGVPVVQSLYRSFHEQNGLFVGLRYFFLFLPELRFATNIRTTLIYSVSAIFLTVPTGILAAHLITDRDPIVRVLRPIYLIPWVIPYVCSSILFRSLFMNSGPVVQIIYFFTGKNLLFLTHPSRAMIVIILHLFWRMVPFTMLFIAAGLTTIPISLYEAGTVDGASRWQQFWHITVPILKPHIFIVTLMVTNGALQDCESSFTITGGGPGHATETLAVRLFRESFKNFDWHSSSVLGIVLLIIASVFIFLYSRTMKSMEENIYE
jgi:multiple sugar transport system permease protein